MCRGICRWLNPAILIAERSTTTKKDHHGEPEMHSSKKGWQVYLGVQVHVVVKPGLVWTVHGTAGPLSEVVECSNRFHDEQRYAVGDARYRGIAKRTDAKTEGTSHVPICREEGIEQVRSAGCDDRQVREGQGRHEGQLGAYLSSHQASVGLLTVCHRGLKKNISPTFTQFGLFNLCMVIGKLMGVYE